MVGHADNDIEFLTLPVTSRTKASFTDGAGRQRDGNELLGTCWFSYRIDIASLLISGSMGMKRSLLAS